MTLLVTITLKGTDTKNVNEGYIFNKYDVNVKSVPNYIYVAMITMNKTLILFDGDGNEMLKKKIK